MKISRLALTNFRSHRKSEYELDRITIFRGLNAAGKSSIQDALEFLLTGTTRQTDAGGRGADLLVSHGKSEMGVQATFDLGTEITRFRNRAGGSFMVRQPGKVDCTGKLADAWMHREFFPAPVLQACLNSGRFLSLAEKDQKSLLTAALASKPVLTPPEVLKALSELKSMLLPLPQVENAAEVDRVYQWAYDERTALNREIKALGELTAPEVAEDTPSAGSIRDQLYAVRRERDVHLETKIKRLANHKLDRQRLAEARTQYDQFKGDILEDAELERLRKTATRKDKAVEIEQEINKLTLRITADRALVKQMKDAPDACHACGRALVKDDVSAKVAELEQAIKTAEGLREEATTRLTKLGDPATAQRMLDAHKKAVIATGSAERALKELKDLPETCDVSDLDKKIVECDERNRKGEKVLADVEQIEGAKTQYNLAATQKEALTKRVVAAETIIEAFGPSGPIRAQLVGDRIFGFHKKLNESLERLGFNCDFALEPYHIELTEVRDGKIDQAQILNPRQLSESEAFRFGIAFQIALAEATGLNFVVIDRSDMLLADLRSTLIETLLDSELDQAIVLVAGEAAPVGALPPGVRLYDLAKDQTGNTAIAAEYLHHSNEPTYEEIPQ